VEERARREQGLNDGRAGRATRRELESEDSERERGRAWGGREVRARPDFIGRERGEGARGERKQATSKAINVNVTTINGERKWGSGEEKRPSVYAEGGERARPGAQSRRRGGSRGAAHAGCVARPGGGVQGERKGSREKREGGPGGAHLAVRGRGGKMGGGAGWAKWAGLD
jgi:hypothetical protein